MTSASPSPNLEGRAIDLLRRDVFPAWWAFIPVAGKATYVKEWAKKPLTRELCIEAYKANSGYAGLGVVTGEFSGGLIALDIDGLEADERYREVAGRSYAAPGEEATMSWTSGREGRRQILYRVPASVVPELRHVKTLILRGDGVWHLGHSDVERQAAKAEGKETNPEYQEVVLRFNACQSVVPGSPHPETKKPYKFLNYNDGQVAMAPAWVMDVLRGQRKPVQWLSDADQKALDAELGETAIPSRQIRGWFFKEEVQARLRPRLADLVFNHPTFDKYGWQERSGENPQRMSGCPWHGGRSGTSFQYSVESGCWDCKACGVGGDVLDFKHKIETGDLYAERPQGPDLERYVAELATEIGFNYPEDARAQVTKEAPRVRMNSVEFHEALGKIFDEERITAVQMDRMAQLAADTGRHRMTGKDCLAALGEYRYQVTAEKQNLSPRWFDEVQDMDFIIPNLLVRPGQVILHAAGGVGKTSACMGLAKAVGTGTPIRVRGIEVDVVQGPVLWIQSDQTLAKLKRDLQDNEIDPVRRDKWFHFRRGFQINQIQVFTEWVREIKPVLVVVDSIGSCSSRMQVSEIEKAFATPLYHYNEANGSTTDDGFPPCTIVWIHHDNANGEIRGNRYLVNAIDEQWHLRKLKDEERDAFRERGENPSAIRMIQIKKSRAGREGDLLKVTRDPDFAYSVEDYTPTVRREDEGQGDPEPTTLVLDIVKQACRKQVDTDGVHTGVTAEEVWSELHMQMQGLQGNRARIPTQKTVRRWLQRWVEDGMLLTGRRTRRTKGPAPLTYLISRALPSNSMSLSLNVPEFFQGRGSNTDTENECPYSEGSGAIEPEPQPEALAPDPVSAVEAQPNWDTASECPNKESGADRDLGQKGTRDIATGTTHARGREAQEVEVGMPEAVMPDDDGGYDAAFGGG